MPQFYEIGLLSGIGYISLIIFSAVAYFSGKVLPLGLGIIPIPFIVELIISIYYIKISIENKRVHMLCFSVIIFIIAFIIGINVDIYETENTKKCLLDMGNKIEEYMITNNINVLSENDIENIILPKNMRLQLGDDAYRLIFNDGAYYSKTKKVHFRPRP